MHTCIYTYRLAVRQTNIQPASQAHRHTSIQSDCDTEGIPRQKTTGTHMYRETNTYIDIHCEAYIHTYIHAAIERHANAHTHTYISTHNTQTDRPPYGHTG